uniref:Ig-like domain-containing protein n=1 Tax=Accipiter nisus TaxID=211598 RepID=A0A8B9MFP4_9AVES
KCLSHLFPTLLKNVPLNSDLYRNLIRFSCDNYIDVLQQPQDKVSVTAGETLTLTCTTSGTGPLGPVEWLKGHLPPCDA